MKKAYRDYRLDDIQNKMQRMQIHPLDVLVVGVTGAGKSTTLNTFFQKEVAEIGLGVDPKTMEARSYRLNTQVRLWDTPGFGDSVERDARHAQAIKSLLQRTYHLDGTAYGLVDLVLVILDGGSRDMGTTNRLLQDIILPFIQPDRVLVAINQADMGMKGQHWDRYRNTPDDVLQSFLWDKEASIIQRVRQSTGLIIRNPVSYSALYDYNITGLYDLIIDNIPSERRPVERRYDWINR